MRDFFVSTMLAILIFLMLGGVLASIGLWMFEIYVNLR